MSRAAVYSVAMALLGAVACSGDHDPAAADGGTDSQVDGSAQAACSGSQEIPDPDTMYTFEHDGIQRSYRLHVPSGYQLGTAVPLVLNFHGYTSSADQQQYLSVMDDVADSEGFAVAYPQGSGGVPSWNAGACCGAAAQDGIDDVGFVSAVLDHVSTRLCIDPRRVYSTGLSNGGFLSHRLACELSDRIAAIAPVAGVIGIAECEPSRSVPVLQIHGTDDTLVPYEGSEAYGFPSVADTVAGWAERNGCTGDPQSTFAQGDASCQAWTDCGGGATVELCTIDEGGHTWPGGLVPVALGKTSMDLSASEWMWQFFQSHSLPE